jgi:hypothetical protein
MTSTAAEVHAFLVSTPLHSFLNSLHSVRQIFGPPRMPLVPHGFEGSLPTLSSGAVSPLLSSLRCSQGHLSFSDALICSLPRKFCPHATLALVPVYSSFVLLYVIICNKLYFFWLAIQMGAKEL